MDTELRQVGNKFILDNVELPPTRRLSSCQCAVGNRMALWISSESDCHLEKVKDLFLENAGNSQLIDREEKVLLSITQGFPSPSECGELTTLF